MGNRIVRPTLFALGLCASAGTAIGQALEEEDLALVYGDKTTVSIATGAKQPLRRAPAVATVITAEDIAAMGATDMDQVLETVAGVHVASAGTRNFSIYQFRGVFGNPTNPQVLLLLNGIPLNTLYRGDKGEVWGDQPLENVARIEVIRGPGSALYGADAYAGVINIITKTAAEVAGTEAGVRAGSFGSWNTWLQHGGKLGALDVAAYLRVGSTDGYRGTVSTDAQTARDLARGTHASLAPGPVNTGFDAIDASVDLGYEKWRLRAGYKLRDNLGTGTGISSALDPVGQNKGERLNADVSWTDPQFAQHWGLAFSGSYFQYAEDEYLVLAPPGTKFTPAAANFFPNGMIGNPGRKERQLRLSGYATYSGFAGHQLRIGAGHDDLDMYETSTHKNYLLTAGAPIATAFMDYYAIQPHILPQRRTVDYVYAQDEWHFAPDWTVTAGLRRDQYSDAGGTTNPRLALVWDARVDLTAKLLYGQAFRAPAFTEQYGVNPIANGNPGLRPETSRTLEAALSWQASKDLQLNLSLYRLQLENIIAVSGGMFTNASGQRGRGGELEAVWDLGRTVRLTANYSYQVTLDDSTGQDVGYAPHHHLYARADWQINGGWLASAQLNRVEDRKRAFGDARPAVPDYTTVDVTLRTNRGNQAWNFAASVRNLFDATVLEPSLYDPIKKQVLLPNDIPMPGRSFYLQASHAL